MSTHSTATAHEDHHAGHGAVADHSAAADHSTAGGHGHHGGHGHRAGYDFAHPFPVWGLLAVFFTLVFLTILTVAQASFDLGGWDIALSLFIATLKALLVVAFFMHLIYDKSFNAIVFLSSIIFLALFIGGTLMDSQTTRDLIITNVGDSDQVVTSP